MSDICSLEQIIFLLNKDDWKKFGIIQNFSSSGKGGQRKNRVKTAIRLTCPVTQEQVSFGKYRETQRNLDEAVRLLRLRIAVKYYSLYSPKDILEPSFFYPINVTNFQYPLLVFRCLTVFLFYQGKISESAQFLKISSSKLTRFFFLKSQVISEIQKIRKTFGLTDLK